jgi:hypothetical protein
MLSGAMTKDTEPESGAEPAPRRLGRSLGALVGGFAAVVALSLATDQLLHSLEVYPAWGQPMRDIGDNLLALGYRIAYAVLGSYLAARLAPRHPMRHALALGWAGLALSLLGAIVAIPMDLGPSWYPVGLVLTALPCAWLGGALHRAARSEGAEAS